MRIIPLVLHPSWLGIGSVSPASVVVKQYWKNWTTRDDLTSLAQWEQLFGQQSSALLVFAYNIVGNRSPLPVDQLFEHDAGLYGFVGIRLSDYAYHARPISAAWDTLAMPTAEFRNLATPMEALLQSAAGTVHGADLSSQLS